MEPDKVCKYFTSKQMKKELTASSTDVYIRYFYLEQLSEEGATAVEGARVCKYRKEFEA